MWNRLFFMERIPTYSFEWTSNIERLPLQVTAKRYKSFWSRQEEATIPLKLNICSSFMSLIFHYRSLLSSQLKNMYLLLWEQLNCWKLTFRSKDFCLILLLRFHTSILFVSVVNKNSLSGVSNPKLDYFDSKFNLIESLWS